MIRNRHFITFLSLLLFGAMTFADTSWIYLEETDVLELKEGEKEEELKEEQKSKYKVKFHSLHYFGTPGSNYAFTNHFLINFALRFINVPVVKSSKLPLFLTYCCLKIPFC